MSALKARLGGFGSPSKRGGDEEKKSEIVPRFNPTTSQKVKSGLLSGVITGHSGRSPSALWSTEWGNTGLTLVRTDEVDAGRTVRVMVSDRSGSGHLIEVLFR